MLQLLRSRVDLWARLTCFRIIFTMVLKPTLWVAEAIKKMAPLLSFSLAAWANEKLGRTLKFFSYKEGVTWWNS